MEKKDGNSNGNIQTRQESNINNSALIHKAKEHSQLDINDINIDIKTENYDKKEFNPNVNVKKNAQAQEVKKDYNNTNDKKILNNNNNNSSIKGKENIKDNKKNNENKKANNNNEINFETPTGDPEIENYYQELKKENNENNENNNDDKENNGNMINSYCLINDSIKNIKKEDCFDINDLAMKPSKSISNFLKAPNVILENDKNSSFINCVIYLLANCINLAKYYLKELNTFKFHIKDMPLSYYFSRIIFHFYPYPENPLQKSFSLSNFRKLLFHLYSIMFQGNDESNAIDFLVYLLDKLHEDDMKLRNKKSNNQKICDIKKIKDYIQFLKEYEKSCILDNFCWVNQKIKKCLECKSEYITYQNYFTYTLDIKNILNPKNDIDFNNNKEITILDCIKYQIQKKIINEQYCMNCQKKNSFEFESLISVLPQYFILLIDLDDNNMKNILPKITIEEDFNLSDIVKQQSSDNQYIIHGIIFYNLDFALPKEKRGQSEKYLAYCYNQIDNKWYNHKKNSIVDKKIIFSPQTYNVFPVILIYRHEETNKKK